MCCYFIVGAGSSHTITPEFRNAVIERKIPKDEETLMFPALIVNAAQKINSYLQECIGKVESLSEEQILLAKAFATVLCKSSPFIQPE
jgi:hypothetical protein